MLLDHVIGTEEPGFTTAFDINLIGEYNIAGDLWQIEPLLEESGIRVLSRITGDSTFREVAYAHRAKLNLVVCSRALINVAREMEKKYGIPYMEVSFFGKTEIGKALRGIVGVLDPADDNGLKWRVGAVLEKEERKLTQALGQYGFLKGKRAVLYTGGVKSWSIIQALMDLGIEVAAVGTKKSTFEDEEKMKEILGPDAPLYEDTAPKNLKKLMEETRADILVAGGRNQYLAVKEGFPFVDVNQERHTPYAGYGGLVNLAADIAKSIRFYAGTGDEFSGWTRFNTRGALLKKEKESVPLSITALKLPWSGHGPPGSRRCAAFDPWGTGMLFFAESASHKAFQGAHCPAEHETLYRRGRNGKRGKVFVRRQRDHKQTKSQFARRAHLRPFRDQGG